MNKQLNGEKVTIPEKFIVNGFTYYHITRKMAFKKVKENKIFKILLEPVLQPWAGKPPSNYLIVSLFDINGLIYFAKIKKSRLQY